jgi:hypothetical protein
LALKSQRFAGDQKLEAAASADKAHIVRGQSGVHVAKIQGALIELDGAAISGHELQRSVYGESTSTAVLAFKSRRKIVNLSYQSRADDIVGKMTMAVLDAEMLASERISASPPRLEPITPKRNLSLVTSRSISSRPILRLGFAVSAPEQAPRPEFDSVAVDISVFGVGSFRVVNGIGGVLSCDPAVAAIFDPLQATAANFVPVTQNPQVFNVRGLNPGLTTITLQKPFASFLLAPPPLVVIVRGRTKPVRVFIDGVEHNHPASGKWAVVSSNPRNAGSGDDEGGVNELGILNGKVLGELCKRCPNPNCVIEKVISLRFGSLPLAKKHIDLYLRGGGRDFNEDQNIAIWIRSDGGIRQALVRELDAIEPKRGRQSGHFEFSTTAFEDTDFQFSFGSIDRIDFEFDFDLDECTIWFKDRYEWHPFYPDIYPSKAGDERRQTNCVHAAFVEMKQQGAADFWMRGEATVPIQDLFR